MLPKLSSRKTTISEFWKKRDTLFPSKSGPASVCSEDVVDPTDTSTIKYYEQAWNTDRRTWVDAVRMPEFFDTTPRHLHHQLVLYNRRNSENPHKDHVWVVIHNKELLDVLKPYFEDMGALTGLEPGIDARHVYARRKIFINLVEKQTSDEATSEDQKKPYRLLDTLLKFVNDLPVFRHATAQLEHSDQSQDPRIEWNLVWTLFTRGDLAEKDDNIFDSGCPIAFRVESWVYEETNFTIEGHYLQWTGRRFIEQPIRGVIRRYEDQQKVDALPIKPLTEAKHKMLTNRGLRYIKYAGVNHLQYRTHMFLPGPFSTIKEKADGRMMVDVLSFRRFNPGLASWSSEDLYEDPEERGGWLRVLNSDHPDICTLPPTLHGWSFAAKKWGEFLVEKLEDISFDTDMFRRLVLHEDDKTIVQSLVEAQAGLSPTPLFSDMPSNKGVGLVILLHGSPGTGKTLTAEAVSERLKLPLYSVSCNEFGTDLGKVETKLKNIMEISSLWHAVVLIDEADIFLEARSDNLKKNAVVGVFLRMLEYQSGIVILTTNRVKKFDEAFRSRISVALRYKDFDPASRKILWKRFLNLAGATVQDSEHANSPFDISETDIDYFSQKNVNGRTIRQLVRTAQALAGHEKTHLNANHIHKVWNLMDAFDRDMEPEA